MKLNIDTRVRLDSSSRWGPQSTYRGKEYQGTIVSYDRRSRLPYRVRWDYAHLIEDDDDTHFENAYSEQDLIVIQAWTNEEAAYLFLKEESIT